MKKNLLIYLVGIMALNANIGLALEKNTKLGHPTQEELTMTSYSPDPTAAAVVLSSSTDATFAFVPVFNYTTYECKERIKVLSEEGIKAGTIKIVLFDPIETNYNEEEILGLKVSTYNLENGKTVRSKMNKKAVTQKRIDDNHCVVTFSAPDVKVGSVIEYEYERHSHFYLTPDTWYAQGKYPVFTTRYSHLMPSYFGFRYKQLGIKLQQEVKDEGYGTNPATTADRYIFTGSELPALDPSSPDYHDLCSRVEHDLVDMHMPNGNFRYYNDKWMKNEWLMPIKEDESTDQHLHYQLREYLYTSPMENNAQWNGVVNMSFNGSWPMIVQCYTENQRIKKDLEMANPLAQKQQALGLTASMSIAQRVNRLQQLLQENYKWNGSYSIWNNNTKDEHAKDMGGMNLLMLSMLRDAGIEAYPILLSRKSKGALPTDFASARYINAMIISIKTEDGGKAFLDPTNDLPLGVLPEELHVVKGLEIIPRSISVIDICKE